MEKDEEVRRLRRSQRADDSDAVRRQRFGRRQVATVRLSTAYAGLGDSTYDPGAMIEEGSPTSAVEAVRRARLFEVSAIVAGLSEELREAYRMIYAERLSIRQAAELAKVAPGTMQYRLGQVQAAVRKGLEHE